MTTYDVFQSGGAYGWQSIGHSQSPEEASALTGAPMELRGETVHSYQDKEPLGGRPFDMQTAHERQVIAGTRCMSDAVSTHDGWVKDVRICGYFPR